MFYRTTKFLFGISLLLSFQVRLSNTPQRCTVFLRFRLTGNVLGAIPPSATRVPEDNQKGRATAANACETTPRRALRKIRWKITRTAHVTVNRYRYRDISRAQTVFEFSPFLTNGKSQAKEMFPMRVNSSRATSPSRARTAAITPGRTKSTIPAVTCAADAQMHSHLWRTTIARHVF